MTSLIENVSSYTIKANGQALDQSQLDRIHSISIEQNLHLPDAFSITFEDIGIMLTDQNLLPIGAEVEIAMGYGQEPAKVFNGEVTAHAVDFARGAQVMFIVRGYDRAHRLQRGRQSRSFLNMTDSDIVTKIAREAGLRPHVDSTSQVYAYMLQNNQTNWEFLRERAAGIGYEVYVEGTTLHFSKPKVDDAPALSAQLWSDALRSHVEMTSAGQVNDVTVRSWDVQQQQAITGRATRGAVTAKGGQQQSGAALATPFGSASMVVTRYPVRSQAEADTLAQAIIDDLAGNAVRLDAELLGVPSLRPGQVVTLDALGDRFSGQYYVTGATHYYGSNHEYNTFCTVSGRRSDSLLELVSGSAQSSGHGAAGTIAIGVVTNNKDDQGLGRVKVKLPWLSDDETDWARIVTPSGGGDRGFYWLPEVNDEVLVAFEQGDANTCYVIGSLWNDKGKPPKANNDVVNGEGKVTQRIIKSRSGHIITIDDSDDNSAIKIVDSSGQNTFTIDTKNKKITISAEQDLELKAGQDVKITAGQNFSVDATQDAQIKATNNAKVTGMQTTVEGTTSCEVKSDTSAKLGAAMVSVEASGNCAVKGAIVQIN